MEDNVKIKEDNIRERLSRLEAVIKEKDMELKRIREMNGYRIFLFASRLRRQAVILIRTACRLLVVAVLFIFTLLAATYLYLLKKLRKSEIFPGG